MRPALKAGLRPLWRDRETLQIGVDPRRARALTGLGQAAAVVSLLDGAREVTEITETAQRYGIRPEVTAKVMVRLLESRQMLFTTGNSRTCCGVGPLALLPR